MKIFGNSIPQEKTRKLLTESNRVVTLCGPKGLGKSSFVAVTLNDISHVSDIFISSNSLDSIRDGIAFSRLSPSHSDRRFLCIDDADLLSLPAQDAILKVCEEPHEHLGVVLISHDVGCLKPSLRSRINDPVFWQKLSFQDMKVFSDDLSSVSSDLLIRLANGKPGVYKLMAENSGFEDLYESLMSISEKNSYLKPTPSLLKELKSSSPLRNSIIEVFHFVSRQTKDYDLSVKLLNFASIINNQQSVNSDILWQKLSLSLSM